MPARHTQPSPSFIHSYQTQNGIKSTCVMTWKGNNKKIIAVTAHIYILPDTFLRPLHCLIDATPQSSREVLSLFNFTHGETETERSYVACPKSHGLQMSLRFKAVWLESRCLDHHIPLEASERKEASKLRLCSLTELSWRSGSAILVQ